MKELIASILFILFSFGIVYLLGSFYSADFDISKWTEGTRYTIVCLFIIIVLPSTVAFFIINNQNKF